MEENTLWPHTRRIFPIIRAVESQSGLTHDMSSLIKQKLMGFLSGMF